ncbi:hypothetical protein [Litorimonas sp. WD9-15]|uniref:hypothetical protein n=1 Tax=Litorimonas sp. WD9-15 TaxID=3418716 RepID=UPI003D06BBFA
MTETPITFTAAATALSESEGERVSRQAVSKYAHAHGLVRKRTAKQDGVLLSEITKHRTSFTREVQRGHHLKVVPKTQPELNAPIPLSDAQRAKARKEHAQAETAELALARQKGDLVDLAEAEAAAAEAFTTVKDALLGPALMDTADSVLAVNGLGDAHKKRTTQTIRAHLEPALQKLADSLTELIGDMDPLRSSTARDRFDYLTAAAAHMRADPAAIPTLVEATG